MRAWRAFHILGPVNPRNSRSVRLAGIALATAALGLAWYLSRPPDIPWWKGNLHSHSLWSDGDSFPEMVSDWYKRNGYHFLAISDHNTLMDGERWIQVHDDPRVDEVLADYDRRFGSDWAPRETRADGIEAMRLKTLEEYRGLLEEEGRFLLIPAEEITVVLGPTAVHLNATNLREAIPPQPGTDVQQTLQLGIDAVLAQRSRTGQPMFPHVPHPNFGWAVTPADMIALRGDRFFEIYNGHPQVNNAGDPQHPNSDRIWDIVLAHRIESGRPPIYGLAVDDAHQYLTEGPHEANPGLGWIMVRSPELRFEALLSAMEAGDFYASTGVELAELSADGEVIEFEIRPEEGATYTTQFIGTREGWQQGSRPRPGPRTPGVSHPRTFSDDIGAVLSEQRGTSARYELQGDELYVRARIVSSRSRDASNRPDEFETAWTQPVVPAHRLKAGDAPRRAPSPSQAEDAGGPR